MSSVQALSDAINVAYTNDEYGIGSRYFMSGAEGESSAAFNTTNRGDSEWIWIYNDDAAALAAGDVVQRDTGDYANYDGIRSTSAAVVRSMVLGVANHAVAAGSYGWVVRNGLVDTQGDGSISQGDAVVSHSAGAAATDGHAQTMAAGEEHMVIGTALAADGVAGTTFLCDLRLG